MEPMAKETWILTTRPWRRSPSSRSEPRSSPVMRQMPDSSDSSGELHCTTGPSARVVCVMISHWRAGKHPHPSIYCPVQWRDITMWCTPSSCGKLKGTGLFALHARTCFSLVVKSTGGTCFYLEVKIDVFGRLPIELAAEYGTREDVEMLFPFTSPISTVANWSADGIISHVKMEIKQLEDGNFVKMRISELKLQGDEAFKKQDYLKASVFYTQGGANLTSASHGDNPLVKAAEKGLTDVTKCLLEAGANPNVLDMVRMLIRAHVLDHGADLHQKRSGNVTLHSAAIHGHSEIVKFLLSRGADVDALSVTGTPLSLASFKGHASTVKILLQHNADPNKGTHPFGPLDMALRKSFVFCAKLLIQGGANLTSASHGDNPLVKAAEKGLTEVTKCLLEAGANPNVLDMFVRLPIELAAEYGTREDVEMLFPFTSPISTVSNWSVDGISSHVKMEIEQLEDGNFVKTRMSELKRQGNEAFEKQDYLKASVFYTQALKMDNFDAKLLSNRSLCFLRMGDGQRAYEDATECAEVHPKWVKAHYRLGAAFMFMKNYDSAYHALSRALELDPESEEVEKLFWEAM